ncbi:hypothetical protein Ct9H90mP29_08510 [bacterium]|nr:MAG: hypothetical protein Ct9H90mP29_08510 [bacterium]
MGQTGVLLGEILGMPTATLAIETDIQGETIRLKGETGIRVVPMGSVPVASFCQYTIWIKYTKISFIKRYYGS